MMIIALLVMQALTPSEVIMERQLLDARRAQLDAREAEATRADIDWRVASVWYSRCSAARAGELIAQRPKELDVDLAAASVALCRSDRDVVQRRAIAAIVAWNGQRATRGDVAKRMVSADDDATAGAMRAIRAHR